MVKAVGLDRLPRLEDNGVMAPGEEHWRERAEAGSSDLKARANAALADAETGHLIRGVFAYSPYLTGLMTADVGFALDVVAEEPDPLFRRVLQTMAADAEAAGSTAALMAALRRAKRRAALLIALADIAGAWPVEQVTGALTELAETALRLALAHLLASPAFAQLPGGGAGLVILGMGKLGARELNYSSDIDLTVFFDDLRLGGSGGASDLGPAFVRLVRALVRIMEERTADGYVFRTDLRLRPDPGAMPLAVSLSAAEIYYGSLGQNWERAAMIKARQVAGDPAAAETLFSFLKPWVWRRNLDFAAIEDIHSIKRQIDQRKLRTGSRGLYGHNVKLGRGGIREIEFFAQTQQLIFGGREPNLRAAGTCEALHALAAARRIDQSVADDLIDSYQFLRMVEHRLQMVNDQQTHTLPTDADGMERIARFLGFADGERFMQALGERLAVVQGHFAGLFARSQSLSGPGSLVFTGVEDDPETLKTLEELGYGNATGVAAAIRGWHHGRYRATRSQRARELLTELTPPLLAALAASAEPDAAFRRFDALLAGLPAGVTLLALFTENPELLALFGRVLGSAPALADQLAQAPFLLDELLSPDFFAPLADAGWLARDLDQALGLAQNYEDTLTRLRRWAAGRKFQAGIHVLERITDGIEAGYFLATVAELAISRLLPLVEAEFAIRHGRIPGASIAVLAFGRLGGKVMSFTSDLDLVAIYEAPEGARSDGAKSLDATLYHTRLTQRLVAAITAPMREGRLWEVDLRLRPSGEAGPVAVSLSAFARYQAEGSWTWEHMALTRARVIAGPPGLAGRTESVIRAVLTAPRDPSRLVADVADMRRRIAREHPARSRWDFKYVPGGLIDIEFAIQYLLLREAPARPDLLATESARALAFLARGGALGPEQAADLSRALALVWRLQGLIRLTTPSLFDPESAPATIKAALVEEIRRAAPDEAADGVDFAQAETILDRVLEAAHRRYHEIVEAPAANLATDPS